MIPFGGMTPEERAQLAAADHYEARARALADLPDTEPRPVAAWRIDAPALLARARRAELLDPEPSPYTIGGYPA